MATVSFKTVEGAKGIRNGDIFGYWELRPGDTALPVVCPRYADKSIQMFGTWDGANVALQGTNDPDLAAGNYQDLYDFEGTTISQTAARKPWVLLPNVYAIKPTITGGTTSVIRVALVGRGDAA